MIDGCRWPPGAMDVDENADQQSSMLFRDRRDLRKPQVGTQPGWAEYKPIFGEPGGY